MTTTTVTHHPVRSDVREDAAPASEAPANTRWALAGLGAGLAGIGAIVSASMVSAVYDEKLAGDSEAIAEKLTEQVPQMFAFHGFAGISAVLMIVFGAGLYRRLRAVAPDSVAPMVAFSGLLGTALVMIMGAGLDTEFIFAFLHPEETKVDASTAVFFNNWLGTIPFVWVLVGLSGVALHSVAKAGGIPTWLGRVGLLGGGLTLLVGLSPLQYMAGFPGPIGLTVVALGFLVGDKVYRRVA